MERVLALLIGVASVAPSQHVRVPQAVTFDSTGVQRLPGSFVDPLSAVALPDGSFVVADLGSGSVTKLSQSSSGVWSERRLFLDDSKRAQPYRIGRASQNGHAVVYDLRSRSFYFVNASGAIAGGFDSDIQFAQVNDVVRSNGMVVVAGTTRDSRGAAFSIHVLDARFNWIRSFGPLPVTSDNSRIAEYGVGTLELSEKKALLFSPKSSAAIQELDLDGKALQRFARLEQRVTPPESVFVVERLANGARRFRARSDVLMPARAFKVGPTAVMYGFSSAGELSYTILSRGEFAKVSLPASLDRPVILALDAPRCRVLIRTGGPQNREVWVLSIKPAMKQLATLSRETQRCA